MNLPIQTDKATSRYPVATILLVSLLAVVINCHPVIFGGRSYVSPACCNTMVFNSINRTNWVDVHGSDSLAMMLWAVPVGFIESRSVLEQKELPLWNRYSHSGDTLIGQAISMLGDPLQWIVILGHGSAVAWDIKFITAKFLFCAGFGLLILRFFGSSPLSLIFAASAAWCGAFYYIYNHPAFFVFCYAPWILLSALNLLEPASPRRIGWGLVWLLANFACFNAGHIEPAVLLIGGLNLAALVNALCCCRNLPESAWVLGRLTAGTALFLALTAPVWMTFLSSLEGSYTMHSVEVRQLPLAVLPGVFDDFFYLLLPQLSSSPATAPGTNFLVLTGCLLSALRWRQCADKPLFWVNTGAIVLWGGCIFGWVPKFLLVLVPMVNRIGHTYTDFSYLLVIHLTLQSAYGFWSLAQPGDFRRLVTQFTVVALVIGGMMLAYALIVTYQPIPWSYFLGASVGAMGAPLLFVFLRNSRMAVSSLGWAGILLLGVLAQYRFGLYAFGDENLLMVLGPRMVLNAPSNAVNTIKADKSGPFRTAGIQSGFSGDYPAVYALEDIRSCAPLSNGDYMDILQHFPGMNSFGWLLDVANPAAAQPLLNLLNVKYVLAPPAMPDPAEPGFKVAVRSDFCVLENLDVWPRAFFCDRVVSVSSTKDFIHQLLQDPKQPFVAVTPQEIEEQPALRALKMPGSRSVQAASNYQLGPNSTAFDVHVPSPGIVCLTEGRTRDFIAIANGQPETVLTVNRAFKGIYLDKPGDYHVEFVYRPPHWRLACLLFWVAIGIIAAFTSATCIAARWPRKSAVAA